MIVQFNSLAWYTNQYMFADPEHITLYADIFGLEPYHTLIRETI